MFSKAALKAPTSFMCHPFSAGRAEAEEILTFFSNTLIMRFRSFLLLFGTTGPYLWNTASMTV